MEIKEIVERWVNELVPLQTFAGTVTAVDADANTCSVQPANGGALREGVRLCAAIKSITNPVVVVPVVNSTVICGIIENNKRAVFVMLCTEVEEIQLRGDEFGGLVKVSELVSKLNNIENMLNDLASKFNSHTHILTLTVGTGTAAPTVTPESTVITPTVNADIENDKVKHA
jgi:hypothetical protein